MAKRKKRTSRLGQRARISRPQAPSASIQQQLLDVLETIDRPGTFCTIGRMPAVLPGLEVAGAGPIALPLTSRQATELKVHAHLAPYGKGTETLVDTNVRRVWEIDAQQITLANPEWPPMLEHVVGVVQLLLGLQSQRLCSHLYKLLLYEPGCFFLPHQDGEKLDRMVATLVIVLPSEHEGGELIVRHEGQEETIDFGGPQSRFNAHFAAFYADCEHEIRPLKSGIRLCLIYNLTLERSKQPITAPSSGKQIDALTHVLTEWQVSSAPARLAILLDHEYTKDGLTSDTLKGVDRARARALFEAARQAGCEAYLALVTLWQCGSAEPAGGYGGYGYGYYEDDGHEMGEIIEQSLTAEHFSDFDGTRLSFGTIRLQDDEIVSEEPLAEQEPSEEEFEGYTGNAGMTLDRWYHRAAVVLWPADRHFDVLCDAGIDTAVGGLAEMVERLSNTKKSEQPALQEQCLKFAQRIIARWAEREPGRYYPDGRGDSVPLLPLLEKLGDAGLIAAWIRRVLPKAASVEPGKSLGDVCQEHGWLTFQDDLQELFQQTSTLTIERNARILADLSLRKGKDSDRRKLCKRLAREMVRALKEWDQPRSRADVWGKHVDRTELLPPLVKSLIALGETGLLKQLVQHVLDLPKEYDLTDVQMPVLAGMQAWLKRNVKEPSPPLKQWLRSVHDELQSRAANPPQEPTDWRRESKTGCKCADCKNLGRFLSDPDTQIARFPLPQHRRQHLHQVIDRKELDTTHVTERRGRPYVLVCKKTNASYERALKAHQVDLDHLAIVQSLIEWHDAL